MSDAGWNGTALRVLRLVVLLGLLPLATGLVVVTYQDASLTHWPGKALTQSQLREGGFPFVHSVASCGQPLAGNPNFGVFLPDTLLLLALPLPVAFGLRFALPLLLGFVGARRWARAEGLPRVPAEIAAFIFVLSGVFVSTWRFYNSGLALALAPWVMAALARLLRRAAGRHEGTRRAAAELGLWGGLETLAGEPVIALLTGALGIVRIAAFLLERPAPKGARRRGLLWVAAGATIAGLLAAPQIAATAQILPESSRGKRPFAFVVATGTSTHPERLIEQVVPFPWGRPDRRGASGFSGHEVFGNHPPYLWTLHLGLPALGVLLLFARPAERGERHLWIAAGVGALLAFGRYLPGAKALYPVLSLGGRIRMPVKWWYLVVLALVPLVAMAARRWQEGAHPDRPRVALGAGLLSLAAAVLVLHWPATLLAALGPLLSLLAALALVATARRDLPRSPALLAWILAAVLLACDLPLLLAFLDRPPQDPPRLAPGRVFARIESEAHPPGPATLPAGSVRAFYRRAPAELWPLTATGSGYAFDDDPDGAYADHDRAVRRLLDRLPWPDRAAELRLAGVAHVVADEVLPPPYRERTLLNPDGVRLYALDGALPSVRFATRIVRRPTLEAVMEHHRREGFDPDTDVVLLGAEGAEGVPVRVRPETRSETADRLVAHVEAPVPGMLVWSRTFFSAWQAQVDGRRAPTVVADGHLVGVPVPAGTHEVRLRWSRRPVLVGGVLAAIGLSAAVSLRLRRARSGRDG